MEPARCGGLTKKEAVVTGNNVKIDLPWNNGAIFQHPTPPSDMNWPKLTSRKKVGIPPSKTAIKYGIKNAPEKTRKKQYFKSKTTK